MPRRNPDITRLPTDELAHRWAHGNAPGHRLTNPHGNFFALGSVLYSYGSHFPIAEVGSAGEPDHPQAVANARLIAAAPSLLAACETALRYLEANRPKGPIRENFHALNAHENDACKPLRAAISLATSPE